MYRELVKRNIIVLTVCMIIFFLLTLYVTTSVNNNNSQTQLLNLSKIVENEIMETQSEEEIKQAVNRVTQNQEWLSVCVATNYGYIQYDSGSDNIGEGINKKIADDEVQKASLPRESDRIYIKNGRMYYVKLLTNSMIMRTSIVMTDNTNLILQSIFVLIVLLIVLLFLSIVFVGKSSKKVVGAFENITTHLKSLSQGTYSDLDTHHDYEEVTEAYVQVNAVNKSILHYISCIQEERDKATYLINNINEGIVIVDANCNIYSINTRAKKLFNIVDVPDGTACSQVITDKTILDKIVQTINTKEECSFDYYFEDRQRYYFITIGNFITDNGDDYVVVVMANVTEQRKEEHRKAEFIANASHELKTPITSIGGFAELLLSGLVVDEKDKIQYIENIYHESVNMRNLIEELLYLSKLDSTDNSKMRKELLDLHDIARIVVDNYKSIAKSKGITIKHKLGHAQIEGNDRFLIQMLSNLVDNAIKYNSENGTVIVEVGTKHKQPYIKVSDTGQGLSEVDQKRLFERFYRVESSRNRNTGGTGLGLTIVQKIVLLHKGTISVQSAVGQGTTFIIVFEN